MSEDLWIVVYISAGITNAEIVSGRLTTEGIPSRLEYEAIGRIYALTIDGLGEVKVLVPDEYAEKAKEVLLTIYSSDELPWDEE